jgi:hypothetical protein
MNSVEQRMSALQAANRVRIGKARMKEQIRVGDMSVIDALRTNTFPNMAISELLGAQHRWGPLRVARTCHRAGIGTGKWIGTLTDRQLEDLIEAVKEA